MRAVRAGRRPALRTAAGARSAVAEAASARSVQRAAGAALLALLAAAPLLAGCGIRPTSVPVDAGDAPSRAACAPGGPTLPTRPADGETLRPVYLVCGSQLAPVQRGVPEELSGAALAARILDELKRDPEEAEEQAGYTTAVSGLETGGPRDGDPPGTVRLSRAPQSVGSPELAQLVCTYAAREGGTALLAGPDEDDVPYTYRCTGDTLRNPESTVGRPTN